MRGLRAAMMAGAVTLAACGGAAALAGQDNVLTHATAVLHDAAGGDAGSAEAIRVNDGLKIIVEVKNLPAGLHGVHVHAVGKCEAPGFTSAGGHWNPTDKQHGSMNPMGPHMGDLPNISVDADGKGRLLFHIPGATLAELLDADGAALVIHAGEDDLKTDPSGNSGARIACGVFVQEG